MSKLYNYFVYCWKNKTIDEEGLNNAVAKNYLTEEEKQQIKIIKII